MAQQKRTRLPGLDPWVGEDFLEEEYNFTQFLPGKSRTGARVGQIHGAAKRWDDLGLHNNSGETEKSNGSMDKTNKQGLISKHLPTHI